VCRQIVSLQKILCPQIANLQIVTFAEGSANLKNYVSPQICGLVICELICGPPIFRYTPAACVVHLTEGWALTGARPPPPLPLGATLPSVQSTFHSFILGSRFTGCQAQAKFRWPPKKMFPLIDRIIFLSFMRLKNFFIFSPRMFY
jgi:hypothetical protein